MSGADEKFLQTLRETFKVEAGEHIQTIASGLMSLEKVAQPAEQLQLIETVFRAAHSLKGAARAVNLLAVESTCQSLESQFAAWKRRESVPTAQSLDAVHRALDQISAAIASPDLAALTEAKRSPTGIEPSAISAAAAQRPPMSTAEVETVRVSVSSLDERLLEAEELLVAKLTANQRAADLVALAARFEQWRKEWTRTQPRARLLRQAAQRTRVAPAAPQDLEQVLEFIDWNHDYVRALETSVTTLRRAVERDRLVVGRLVNDLLENSKRLLMLPLATLAPLLQKTVRDLCRDQGKEAELTLRGEDVRVDKRILEELKDPLLHLLRNSVDHGIEAPAAREGAGKSRRATIMVAVAAVGEHLVEISVSDDGAGIDVEKVTSVANKRAGAPADSTRSLTDAEALALVFEADVSTSPIITEVSGRGLGLAIVREKTEKLGGRIAIESTRDAGTTIRMTLPLTLATERGVLVRAAQRLFVVPTAQVERVGRFRPHEAQTVEGRRTLLLNGRTVALVDLAEVLHLTTAPKGDNGPSPTPILVLGSGEQRIGFIVDAVLDEREVLVKRLGKPLSRVQNIGGATILGSGEVAPILNVSDLLKSARLLRPAPVVANPPVPANASVKRILIAEDSITSRMLLKGILESAGYEVKAAVDGIDAFTALRAERFDLVVSDVEMPRMNGFDLTARIRAERKLSDLPVVLVTALESRDDRERGIDVGASAYLVKSSLDQGNLLETVRRLT